MRILFWNGPFLPRIGGVEIFTARLAGGLIARGHQVAVACNGQAGDEPEVVPGLQVIRFPFLQVLGPTNPDPRARLRLIAETTAAAAELKRSFAPDLVHVNLSDASPYFHLRSLQAQPSPTLVTFQAALEKPVGPTSTTGALIAEASALVAVSNTAAANAAHFTDLPRDRIEVVYPGVPAAEFTAARAPAPGAPLIGFLGRLAEEKGVQVILQALSVLGGEARLRVIGDGPFRPRLEQLAQDFGVADRVEFAGEVDDAQRLRLMAECRALVVPSLHIELFGMVAVEGGLAGLPVIASAIGGLQEIVVPGETGFLFAAGDTEALAGHLRTITEDAALAARLGAAGRQRALANYTVETTVDRYEALYEAAVAEARLAALA